MQNNRRTWIKQMGLGLAGITLAPLETLAYPSAKDVQREEKLIRLSSNENPYGPSPLALKAMNEQLSNTNRYYWETTGELISAIAKRHQVSDEHVIIGAGSTEILNLLVQYFASSKGSFILSDLTYNSWAKTAETGGMRKITIPLTNSKHHDLTSLLKSIESDTRFIYVCNPNNPTGTLCSHDALNSFIAEATKKVTVVMDEAYLDFTDQPSAGKQVVENKNLIVVKTFSKIFGLAGARIGYALGHKETIEKIGNQQIWANGGVSVVSRAAAIASLKDEEFLKQCYAWNEKVRQFTITELEKLNIVCIPSQTNFIYFSLEKYTGDFFQRIRENGIEGTGIYEEKGKWTRITVGTMDEMKRFIQAIT